MKNTILAGLFCLTFFTSCKENSITTTSSSTAPVWSSEKALAWQEKHGWLVGCNYTPATAINQLEMWQAETFDLPTIEKELQLAAATGFNIIRVYLHDLMWDADSLDFLNRMDSFCKYPIKMGLR
ncbi:MAG: hypothetical protein HC912_00270 [Saprospiraceae bacterium]|nr:hypothetical protein [Saprospiraceae bacterium]